jgi:hypothetical protein
MELDPATWPQLNLLDAGLLLLMLAAILGAIGRGLAKEMLHTVFLAAAITAAWLYTRNDALPATQPELARLLVPMLGFVLAAYAFMWAVVRFGSVLIINTDHAPDARSRFWAGALALTKVLTLMLGLNLWFAVKSPYGPPLRLASVPTIMQQSRVVNISDHLTERLYRFLAQEGFLTYQKIVEEAPQPAAAKPDDRIPETIFTPRPAPQRIEDTE